MRSEAENGAIQATEEKQGLPPKPEALRERHGTESPSESPQGNSPAGTPMLGLQPLELWKCEFPVFSHQLVVPLGKTSETNHLPVLHPTSSPSSPLGTH